MKKFGSFDLEQSVRFILIRAKKPNSKYHRAECIQQAQLTMATFHQEDLTSAVHPT